MADEQWVNLEKDAKHEEDGITQERIAAAHVECEFEKANLAGFRVKVYPVGDHAKYSARERTDNANFRVRIAGAATNGADKKIKLDKEIFLTAAGGNEYKIKAKYKKKEIESGKVLKVRRKLYYQLMKMPGCATCDLSGMENLYWDPAKKFYIKLKKKGALAQIEFQKNLTDADKFIKSAGKKFELKGLKPFAFAVAFVRYICKPAVMTIRDQVNLSVPAKICKFSGEQFTVQSDQFLWFGLDDADDAAKAWLVDGRLVFVPAGKTAAQGEQLPFDRDDVAIAGPDYKTYGGKAQIKVRIPPSAVTRNFFTKRAGKLFIELEVKTADNWSNGFAYNQINLAAIADRAVWEDQPLAVQLYTVNHEIGHKIGMVADGTGTAPDSHANLYGENRGVNDRGHQGPHCGNGASWDGTDWSGQPGCVMFGADGVWDTATNSVLSAPSTYCSDCEKIVRKLDLSRSTLVTKGFSISVEEYP